MIKIVLAIVITAALLAQPVHAQDNAPSMMEQGARKFFEGLMQEMAPALDELSTLMEQAGPALQSFLKEMGPKLRSVLEDVEDWSIYSAPEVLPNGDIIIRRKPDVPEAISPAQPAEPQIDL